MAHLSILGTFTATHGYEFSTAVEELNTMISDLGLTLFHIHTDLYTYMQNVYDIYMKTTCIQNDYDYV
jgi:hypothetical protein